MDQEDNGGVFGNQDGDVKQMMIDVQDIKMHPTFANLLRIDPDMQEKITQSMRVHGFFESHPLVEAVWPGQEDPVLIDGNTRLQAALAVGLTHVPVVIVRFDSELEVLQRVIQPQADRRAITHGALYRLCAQFDRLMEAGRPRKNGETGKLPPRGGNFLGRSASARKTAQLVGCNFRKVERIRKIRRDGWPEIQEAVRNDEMTINKAYKLIRDMELGNEDNGKKVAAARIRAAKTLLSEENFAFLDQLGGNVGDHVNKALEVYMQWLKGQESAS